MIFDDSFEHFVTHEGGKTRVVLFWDIWHPDWQEADLNTLITIEKEFQNKHKNTEGNFINRMQQGLVGDRHLLQGKVWWQ